MIVSKIASIIVILTSNTNSDTNRNTNIILIVLLTIIIIVVRKCLFHLKPSHRTPLKKKRREANPYSASSKL